VLAAARTRRRSIVCKVCSSAGSGPPLAGADGSSLERLRSDVAAARAVNVKLRGFLGMPAQIAPGESKQPLAAAADPVWPEAGEEFWTRQPWRAAAASPPLPASSRTGVPLSIVHCACEIAPWAKIGGLADVVTGLSRACLAAGHSVTVLLPHYSAAVDSTALELGERLLDFDVPFGRSQDGVLRFETLRTSAQHGWVAGVEVVLLRPLGGGLADRMFRGPYGMHGGVSERESSLFFSRACLEYLCARPGARPDVIHCHEWQTAAVPMLYWSVFNGCLGAALVLTLHNADSAGECRVDEFAASGTSGDEYMTQERALDERTIGHNPERLSLLKGGVVYANAVTTVSRTYQEETLRAGWLGGVLSANAGKYSGVVNGIDAEAWDPATDPALPFPYSAAEMGGKARCKAWVRRGLGLAEAAEAPLVIAVTRLVSQKGIAALLHAAHRCEALGYQFVLLGTGAQDGAFRALAAEDERGEGGPAARSRRLLLRYSEPLARLLFAAADVTLVPSLFEPCGLTQLLGQRYGAVPLVRRTGGLADTVADGETGFVIDGSDGAALEAGLARALALFRGPGGEWADLVRRCMESDVSWAGASREYETIYRQVVAAVRRR